MSLLLSLDATSLLLGGVVLLCLWWWLSTRRPLGLPPGPGPALPLLGHLHLLGKDPRPQFCRWRRQYGDVFSLYMGGRLTVVLASYSAIKEAFVAHADLFSERPHSYLMYKLTKDKGIVITSGRTWKEQRKTATEILRAMGMGKNVLADKIQEEVTHYIRAIKDHQGAPVDLAQITQISVSNNICSIIFGKRFDYDDPDFISYLKRMDCNFKLLSGTAILSFMPRLRFIPGDPFKMHEVMANSAAIFSFIDKQIEEHQQMMETGEESTDQVDFIYSYLHQIKKAQDDVDTTINGANLQKAVDDLFVAGTETTATALQWALLFFLHYPHVQEKCFQEISDVIGHHRPPSMRDKPNLTYLEATICEVLRKGDAVPLAVQHTCDHDVMFRGYVIPEETFIIPNLSGVLQDPDIWGDPENFRPERFIGPDGKLTKPEEFVPFSTGRRVCLGESLARMELFLYLATLIQHFRFLPPEEGQLPSLEGEFGLTHTPQPFKIRAVSRM